MQWEYVSLVSHVEGIRNELNTLGRQGWELVSIVPGQFQCTAVFKRPVSEQPPSPKKREAKSR